MEKLQLNLNGTCRICQQPDITVHNCTHYGDRYELGYCH